MSKLSPRLLNVTETFDLLVQWFHDDLLRAKQAPGFLVGLSGTDSIVAFCAAAEALKKLGKLDRLLGVHFAPSEDFLYDHPEADVHLWFNETVVPWLRDKYPEAKIVVDTSIDWRQDGLRWGMLMDMSVVRNDKVRTMRLADEQYWVVGTRNRTEERLANYSNASTVVSVQPLIHLWKSEILELSNHLGVPQVAVTKSCETDCICGRMRLAANHIREIDLLLMVQVGELQYKYVEDTIGVELARQLNAFIFAEISKNAFKKDIPYLPSESRISTIDPLVQAFEDGTLDLSTFDHKKHVYVAWYYSHKYDMQEGVEKYCFYLNALLSAAGQEKRFSFETTSDYFRLIDDEIWFTPTDDFEEFWEVAKERLVKKKK